MHSKRSRSQHAGYQLKDRTHPVLSEFTNNVDDDKVRERGRQQRRLTQEFQFVDRNMALTLKQHDAEIRKERALLQRQQMEVLMAHPTGFVRPGRRDSEVLESVDRQLALKSAKYRQLKGNTTLEKAKREADEEESGGQQNANNLRRSSTSDRKQLERRSSKSSLSGPATKYPPARPSLQ